MVLGMIVPHIIVGKRMIYYLYNIYVYIYVILNLINQKVNITLYIYMYVIIDLYRKPVLM